MLEPKVKFDRLQKLAPVLEEYTEWFSRAVRCLQYPETLKDFEEDKRSLKAFTDWLSENENDTFINELTIKEMQKRHGALHEIGTQSIERVKSSGERLSLEDFDKFLESYDAFMVRLHELEHACFEIDSGVDKVSGLRNEEAMLSEVTIELERRARRGNPFCLVIARIDNLEPLKQKFSENHMNEVVLGVGNVVLQCLRTFDEAYRLQNSDFILSLKHTGTAGGTAAINRLRSMIDEANIQLDDDNGKIDVTMSYCLSEPMPGDTVEDLLEYMRDDLKNYGTESEAAVEYVDKSPLARFIERDD